MSRTYFPRVPVGNGKFCYSGPNCKQHGVQASVSFPTVEFITHSPTDAKPAYTALQERLKGELANTVIEFQTFVCNNSKHMQELTELGNDSFKKGLAALKCSVHNSYHVFALNEVNTKLTLRNSVFSIVTDAVSSGEVTNDDVTVLRKEIGSHFSNNITSRIKESQIILQNYRISLDGTNLGHLAAQYRHKERLKRAGKGIQKKKPISKSPKRRVTVPVANPPKILAANVSKELVLEYWVCGRKQKHETEEKAVHALQVNHGDGERAMSAYHCSYCKKYHLGHGFNKDTDKNKRIQHARRHWDRNAEKSDVFAFSKGLI